MSEFQRGEPLSGQPVRGRDDILQAALGVVRSASEARTGAVVLVSGDPGIGKTAVLSEIARCATQMSARVARAKCQETEHVIPAAPILALLRASSDPLIGARDFEELTHLTGNPPLLVERVAELLRTEAEKYRVLIVIDDVHWADPLSRYALRFLIPRLARWPVAWVLASRSRSDALSVGAADVVAVEYILLNPLARNAITDMACDLLGRPPSERENELLDAAGGNPFLATRIVEGLARPREFGADDVPPEFHAAMRYRLSRLSTLSRIMIHALAVAGHPLRLAELCRVCEITIGPDLFDDVSAAISSGLVTATGTDLGFVHDLVRQSIYDAIPTDDRQRLHTWFAQHYLASGVDGARAANHARAAITVGDAASARVMITAAEAMAATSADVAAELAAHAFSMLRPGRPRWLELGERALAVLSGTQRVSNTIAVAERLLATVDDLDTVGRIQTHALKALWYRGSYGEIVQRARQSIKLAGARPHLVARFRAAEALAGTRIDTSEAAAERARAALGLARASGDHDALALGLRAAGEAAHAQRRHTAALACFRELRSVTGVSYLADEIMQLQLLDRFDDAQILLDAARSDGQARRHALAPDVLFAQAKQLYNLGDDLLDADRSAASVIGLAQPIGAIQQVVAATFIRVFVAMLQGKPALAERRLAVVSKTAAAPDIAMADPGVLFCRGWLSNARGDIDHSHALWAQLLAEPALSRRCWAWWPWGMLVAFEGGRACGAADLMDAVVRIAEEGAQSSPEVATLTGVAAILRGLLDHDVAAVADSVEMLRRCPRRAVRAWALENYGAMLLHSGQRRAGLEQLDSAWDEWDHMGASGRRATVQQVMRRAGVRRAKWSTAPAGARLKPLTDAERRVAYLIADGLTDKSVA